MRRVALAHAHGHGHSHEDRVILYASRDRVLRWSFVANLLLLIAEIAGGIAFRSLALLADAAHMASDVVGLSVALIAQRLMTRPHSDRHTYGLQRAEVIGAFGNSLVLIALGIWVGIAAIGRIGDPVDVEGAGLLAVATMGLLVNAGSAVAIRRRAGASLNMRGAYIHMMLDAVGSIGAMVVGVGVVVADADWLDPVASLAIAALVLYSAVRLMLGSLHVLLEGTPRGMAPGEVEAALRSDDAVSDVHHLHMWSITSEFPAMSAHVVLDGEMTLHDAQLHGDRLKAMLLDRFGIEHSTLELECHACEPEGAGLPK